MTGYFDNGDDYDYFTVKYGPDGDRLWVRRYDGPGGTYDYARAVVVDGDGNAIVTGASGVDFYTAKYAAADGSLLWENRYHGSANSYDGAAAVAVDSGGDVVVTGSSYGSDTRYDYYTAKHAAADGALLWRKRYNGPANGDDLVTGPQSLALGPDGMVAVTGRSVGTNGFSEYTTVVYREPLPPLFIDLGSAGLLLHFFGAPGHSYQVQRASSVNGPWDTLATLSTPASGLVEYTDTHAPPGQAFYRMTQP
jgi:hypothetical protein